MNWWFKYSNLNEESQSRTPTLKNRTSLKTETSPSTQYLRLHANSNPSLRTQLYPSLSQSLKDTMARYSLTDKQVLVRHIPWKVGKGNNKVSSPEPSSTFSRPLRGPPIPKSISCVSHFWSCTMSN